MAKRTGSKRATRKPAGRKPAVRLGIMGGSGLYNMPGLTNAREVKLRTPFGDPSDALVVGTLSGRQVAFLARHGRGHRFLPSEVNYRANIYAMKMLGVERIISVSAVGSLREELAPLEFVIPDQFFDRTRGRISTFFGQGLVAHTAFDKPTCADLGSTLADACEEIGVTVHRGGTYVCMEGPLFSTLSESLFYRGQNFDIIGMTNLTEAKLAREAEICYASVSMVTDYDCWHPSHETVTSDQVVANVVRNAENVQKVVRAAVARVPEGRTCRCGSALATAFVTERSKIPAATKRRLAAIVGKYGL
jgi:5'-methylthioadenosine phosphorylase